MMSCSINSKRRLQISPFKSLWAHILFNSFAGRASQLYLVGKIVKVIYYFYDKRLIYIYIYIYIIDRKGYLFSLFKRVDSMHVSLSHNERKVHMQIIVIS